MKRIYIAGALNADAVDYIKNLHRMCNTALLVMKQGYSVFIPGLDFMIGYLAGDFEYPNYFDNSWEWLKVSDGIFVVPGSENSTGVRKEIRKAIELKIPVFRNIDIMNKYFEESG